MVTKLLNMRNGQSPVSVRQSVCQSVTMISARDASASENIYFLQFVKMDHFVCMWFFDRLREIKGLTNHEFLSSIYTINLQNKDLNTFVYFCLQVHLQMISKGWGNTSRIRRLCQSLFFQKGPVSTIPGYHISYFH